MFEKVIHDSVSIHFFFASSLFCVVNLFVFICFSFCFFVFAFFFYFCITICLSLLLVELHGLRELCELLLVLPLNITKSGSAESGI